MTKIRSKYFLKLNNPHINNYTFYLLTQYFKSMNNSIELEDFVCEAVHLFLDKRVKIQNKIGNKQNVLELLTI